MIICAVFRATPGNVRSESKSFGTSPPNFSTSSEPIPRRYFCFRFVKARLINIPFHSAMSAWRTRAAPYTLVKSDFVTRFTRSSVHCAESTVPTTNSSGVDHQRTVPVSNRLVSIVSIFPAPVFVSVIRGCQHSVHIQFSTRLECVKGCFPKEILFLAFLPTGRQAYEV